MSKVLIGISKGKNPLSGEEYYIQAVEEAGGEVIMLPPGREEEIEKLQGLLLPGGGDVDPSFYGENNQASQSIDRERDEWEIELTRRFFKEEKPILGICRGAQVLNVALGGTLHQDIERHKGDSHRIKIKEGSLLYDVLGRQKEIEVDSSHHQGIKTLAPHLRETAWSEDGCIEGIEGEGFVLGVQFHPERLFKKCPLFSNIFKRFVEASKREIYTLGTSKRSLEEFLGILKAYGIEEVIDVRRFPVSHLEWFRKEELAEKLQEEGLSYIWMGEELGGYRSPNYQAYIQTEEFRQGLGKLARRALKKRTAIICAEALPWRCHRRFIAYALEEKGWKVMHIINKERCLPRREEIEKGLFPEEI